VSGAILLRGGHARADIWKGHGRRGYASGMELEERYREGLGTLELLRAELLDAREAAREDPQTWGSWARRYNQRLHGHRARLAILLKPPPDADPRLIALFEAGAALRTLYDEMNRALEGGRADIALRRVQLEAALHRAREVVGTESW